MTEVPRSTCWRPVSDRKAGMNQNAAVRMAVIGLCIMAPGAHAQTTVSGTVVEATNRAPLEGARVVIEGTTRGAMTDNRGRFVITGLTGSDANLRVNRIGFRELRRTVPVGRTDIVLMLEQSAVSLDVTVVTGTPGEETKR